VLLALLCCTCYGSPMAHTDTVSPLTGRFIAFNVEVYRHEMDRRTIDLFDTLAEAEDFAARMRAFFRDKGGATVDVWAVKG
jgi:hypothetical protein